ncbi:MAG: M23 family metallopeptidase, partial [Acidobacteriota bacterium]|nr:M23 family metallopeptidase [Acidobacteriota bacterium]
MTENVKTSGSATRKIRWILKKAFASVTVMVIPHNHVRTLNIKIPGVFLVATILLACVGMAYLVNMTVKGISYRTQNRNLSADVQYYENQFSQVKDTLQTVQSAGNEFKQLFSLDSKEEVLEAAADMNFAGSLDLPDLIAELQKARQEMDEMRNYLRMQTDVYISTPKGYPISEYRITSTYGRREDPVDGGVKFHSGIDLAAGQGTPIAATADGIVSHSGWTADSGYVVVLEHGLGFSTIYAHNKSNAVKVGQQVRRGDIVGHVGATGRTTGPHVHYEVLKDGRNVNPAPYLSGE